MSVKVACPDCAATLKAPDAARGKALKCPKCGGRVPVPAAAKAAARTRRKAPVAAGTGEFLANVDLSRAEDTGAEVCPKCGVVVSEEDVECPNCGADLVTGGKGLTQRRKAKFKSRGEDPRVFYSKAPGDAWRFLTKNADVGVRLGVLASVASTASALCGLMVLYCAYVPPKAFWGGLGVIGVLFLPGCLWVLQEEVTDLTIRGKDKFKRMRFDTLLCVSRGPRVLGWAMVALWPLTILDFGAWAGVAILELPAALVFAAVGAHAVAAFFCWPAAMGHMTMPVSSPGWNFLKLAKGTLANLGPALFWAVLTLAAFVPFLAAVGGVAAVAGPRLVDAAATLNANTAAVRVAEAAEFGSPEPQQADFDWGALLIPGVALVPCAFLFAFGALYAARPAGLLARSFSPSLGLVTLAKEKKYVSTTRKKDEFGDYIDGGEGDALDFKKVGLILAANLGLGLVVGGIASFSFPEVSVTQGMGLGVLALGFLFALGARVAFLQSTDEAGAMWKAICFLPLGELAFTAAHFEEAKYPFFWEVGCVLLMIGGFALAVAGGLDPEAFFASLNPMDWFGGAGGLGAGGEVVN